MHIVNKIDNNKYINITKGRKDKSGKTWVPDTVVCHITEGSYAGAVSWLKNPKASASAHFVVSRKGEITQLVDIKDTAWGNGTSATPSVIECATSKVVKSRNTNANAYTVSIEHEGIFSTTFGALTKEQEEATTFLIKHIDSEIKRIYGEQGKNGIKFDRDHIIGHYEISPKNKPNCPGRLFPFDNIIKNLNISEKTNISEKMEDTEMVTTTDIIIDDKKYTINRILKDGKNYIELRAFEQAGYKIGYNDIEKIPTFSK